MKLLLNLLNGTMNNKYGFKKEMNIKREKDETEKDKQRQIIFYI